MKPTENENSIAEWFKRLQHERKLETRAFALWNPVARSHSMRKEDADESMLRICRGLTEGSLRRQHRLQHRQGERNARAAQKCSARKMFPADEHFYRPPYSVSFMFVWNSALLTIPKISEENL